ncbi:hypothetical protein B0H10DRAFT_2435651 [Mycena sp. CBHHK59/15]|nr:hypothetical protein B0H10DRAFT_2435651 [Mycena sp. CBHHK59/15]
MSSQSAPPLHTAPPQPHRAARIPRAAAASLSRPPVPMRLDASRLRSPRSVPLSLHGSNFWLHPPGRFTARSRVPHCPRLCISATCNLPSRAYASFSLLHPSPAPPLLSPARSDPGVSLPPHPLLPLRSPSRFLVLPSPTRRAIAPCANFSRFRIPLPSPTSLLLSSIRSLSPLFPSPLPPAPSSSLPSAHCARPIRWTTLLAPHPLHKLDDLMLRLNDAHRSA